MGLYTTCMPLSSDTFHDKLFACDQGDDAEYDHDHEEALWLSMQPLCLCRRTPFMRSSLHVAKMMMLNMIMTHKEGLWLSMQPVCLCYQMSQSPFRFQEMLGQHTISGNSPPLFFYRRTLHHHIACFYGAPPRFWFLWTYVSAWKAFRADEIRRKVQQTKGNKIYEDSCPPEPKRSRPKPQPKPWKAPPPGWRSSAGSWV